MKQELAESRWVHPEVALQGPVMSARVHVRSQYVATGTVAAPGSVQLGPWAQTHPTHVVRRGKGSASTAGAHISPRPACA